MGLDVYVGPLTRYYAGDWETVIEQYAREHGVDLEVVRPKEDAAANDRELQEILEEFAREEGYEIQIGGTESDAAIDADALSEAVDRWRAALSEAVGLVLAWDESPEAPYYTDKPAWDGYGSLQVLEAYDEHRRDTLPKRAVSEWDKDSTWRTVAAGAAPRYRHLYAPEIWLPSDFDLPLPADDVAGNPIFVGSSVRLLAELRALNERTYRGSADDLARWRKEGAEADGPFNNAARFGLAVFVDLAEKSVREHLPMALDY